MRKGGFMYSLGGPERVREVYIAILGFSSRERFQVEETDDGETEEMKYLP